MIEEFKKLSFDEKKTKLLTILEQLKNSDEVFWAVINTINTNKNVNDEFLVWIYEDIISLWDKAAENKKQQSLGQAAKLKARLQTLQNQEKMEREQENPEGLLRNI